MAPPRRRKAWQRLQNRPHVRTDVRGAFTEEFPHRRLERSSPACSSSRSRDDETAVGGFALSASAELFIEADLAKMNTPLRSGEGGDLHRRPRTRATPLLEGARKKEEKVAARKAAKDIYRPRAVGYSAPSSAPCARSSRRLLAAYAYVLGVLRRARREKRRGRDRRQAPGKRSRSRPPAPRRTARPLASTGAGWPEERSPPRRQEGQAVGRRGQPHRSGRRRAARRRHPRRATPAPSSRRASAGSRTHPQRGRAESPPEKQGGKKAVAFAAPTRRMTAAPPKLGSSHASAESKQHLLHAPKVFLGGVFD